ncbi:hypothetical protein [Psychrobacter sp.]|uniref:hypothetical protein n=1 Tax=Psychrobacter sp. TaxID=56811 RepID=UPI0025CF7FB8|nr:hypothetical protein [Psychrobacter sp.]
MDWLRNILINLPLDEISDSVNRLTIWWSHLVADVPPDMLPIYAYVGFSVVVLLLWLFIVRLLPSPIGGMSWLALFSILLAPGSAANNTGDVAPASIGVVYGIIMKEPGLALSSLLPILVVFSVGLVLGFIWQLIKNIIEKNAEQSRQQAVADERANMQLASANYMDFANDEDAVNPQPELIKAKIVKDGTEVPVAKQASEVAKNTSVNDLSKSSNVTNEPSDKKDV